jgi:hypothetical protein
MGQFSWITSDTKRAISNVRGKTFPVWMLLPDGTKLLETAYEGYGEFGGRDFYAVVAQLNNPEIKGTDAELLRHGISIAFGGEQDGDLGIQPRFVEDGNLNWEDVENSAHDPNQGWGEEEGDDDND